MTGAPGTETGFSEQVILENPWPPTTIAPNGAAATELPSYTETGTLITLPMPTFTNSAGSTITSGGDGWYETTDTHAIYTPVATCTYPDAWDANSVAIPAPCGPAAVAAGGVVASVTAIGGVGAATRTADTGAATRTAAAATLATATTSALPII